MRSGRTNKGASRASKSQVRRIQLDVESRARKISVPSNPPSLMNAGDVWHSRTVATTSLADASGVASLTIGAMRLALSGNSANIPIRVASIKAWAISGTAGTYPPTFIQVNYANEELMDGLTYSGNTRDSLIDAGGQGGGCPGVGLYFPDARRKTREDATGSSTVLAEAVSLPSGARVLWHINLQFKF